MRKSNGFCLPQLVTAATAHTASNSSAIPGVEQAMVTASLSLNIRCNPTPDAQLIGCLRRGATVKVFARQENWCCIHPRENHWVLAQHLQFN